MIRLFLSDIDGCLAEPYQPYDLNRFHELAALVAEAGSLERSPARPSFTLCSGRAYPYVEAVSQALGVQAPALFEAGAGLFDPVQARVCWHPGVSAALDRDLRALRGWLEEQIRDTRLMFDVGKRTQAGVIGADPAEVARLVPRVEEHVAAQYPDFLTLHTPFSIDVVPAHLTKQQGMEWLAERTGIALEEMAFIGDSNGDLGALTRVGYSFAPANAHAVVRARVGRVTKGALIEGVLEAYRWCLAHNGEDNAPAWGVAAPEGGRMPRA